MALEFITRPLEQWPKQSRLVRRNSPFHSEFPKTLAKLRAELRHLDTKTVVLQLAVPERLISVTTGLPYADARPNHPGVIIAADTKYGSLKWLCDACANWTDNVHAIALTLESPAEASNTAGSSSTVTRPGRKPIAPELRSFTRTPAATRARGSSSRTRPRF